MKQVVADRKHLRTGASEGSVAVTGRISPQRCIVWGQNDYIFPAEGAHPYKRDLTDLEFHLLDTGHFALEENGAEIARLIRSFLDRKVKSRP